MQCRRRLEDYESGRDRACSPTTRRRTPAKSVVSSETSPPVGSAPRPARNARKAILSATSTAVDLRTGSNTPATSTGLGEAAPTLGVELVVSNSVGSEPCLVLTR